MTEALTGFLFINKPKNTSSFFCVNKIRKFLPKKSKVGHSGTLDKEASGLLILCIGRQATKSINNLLNLDKHYTVTAKLGELTTTLDYNGELIQEKEPNFSKEQLLSAIQKMGKEYTQTPPIYSALKHMGQNLYKLAREKQMTLEELETIASKKSRTVLLHELKLLDFKPPFFTFSTHVSKGTYVRALANDIAKHLDSYATTYEIIRTQIGNIKLEETINLNNINSIEDISKTLIRYDQFSS